MTEYNVRHATEEDMIHMIGHASEADRAECRALHGPDVNFATRMRVSYMVSRDTTFVGTVDGVVACMFGVKPPVILNDVAVPWLIGTDLVPKHYVPFLRMSKAMVLVWSEHFPIMENYVHEDHTVAIRWLQWVGFNVYYPKPYGRQGALFHRFDMRRDNV